MYTPALIIAPRFLIQRPTLVWCHFLLNSLRWGHHLISSDYAHFRFVVVLIWSCGIHMYSDCRCIQNEAGLVGRAEFLNADNAARFPWPSSPAPAHLSQAMLTSPFSQTCHSWSTHQMSLPFFFPPPPAHHFPICKSLVLPWTPDPTRK